MPSKKPPDTGQVDLFGPRAPTGEPPKYFDEVPPPSEDDAPPPKAPEAARPEAARPEAARPEPARPAAPRVYSVRELVHAAGRAVEARFGLVWVEGEVSNLSTPRSGHLYFTLKDGEGQLPSVMFRTQAMRLPLKLKDGMTLRARGRLSIYEEQGKLQLYVDAIEPTGLGAAQIAFEQLKEKLAAEGLFDPAKKRPLPRWPRRVGLVTSATGAAVRDILHVAERRGRVRFLLARCQVQGDAAPFEIVAALQMLQRVPDIDVIIVGRGGGSSEDLAAFNDERVARAIAACRVPVVSAVGHEVDFTIADFVADQRAPTPSAAAELVVPLHADAAARLDDALRRVRRAGARALAEARLHLDGAEERLKAAMHKNLSRGRRRLEEDQARMAALHPRARLARDRSTLTLLTQRLAARARTVTDERRRALAGAAGKLDALSPLGVLGRGYSLVRGPDGHLVTDGKQVAVGDAVSVQLRSGRLGCRVESSTDDAAELVLAANSGDPVRNS